MTFRLLFFCASSNLRTTTWHLVVWQICFEVDLTASENRVRPAARSTASTVSNDEYRFSGEVLCLPGTTKLSSGASSGIMALGSTNAPVDSSRMSGVEGDVGLDVRTTFAKCVGTETLGGDPITSCVWNLAL